MARKAVVVEEVAGSRSLVVGVNGRKVGVGGIGLLGFEMMHLVW